MPKPVSEYEYIFKPTDELVREINDDTIIEIGDHIVAEQTYGSTTR